MVTFDAIKSKYVSSYKESEARSQEIRQKAEQAREASFRYQKLSSKKYGEYLKLMDKSYEANNVSWLTDLVRPLLEEVDRQTGLCFSKDSLCTFGIRSECPVFSKDCKGKAIAALTFTIGDMQSGELYIDTGQKESTCGKGSIGEINGLF